MYSLRPGVIQKLRSGDPLSRSDRSNITEACYQHVTKFTYYPKEWQYTEVVTAFLEEFPKVKDKDGIEVASNLWRQRIQYRFQNDRNRRDKNIPMKRKLSKDDVPSQRKGKAIIWGLANYLPVRPEGEDDDSILRHEAALKTEMVKRHPDHGRLDRLMALTFSDRRNFIINENPLVCEIKEKYPALFESENAVLKEFRRIAGKEMEELICEGSKKYHQKLMGLAKTQENELLQILLEHHSSITDDEEIKDLYCCVSLLMVPLMLKERVKDIVRNEEQSMMEVFLLQTEDKDKSISFSLVVESKKLFSCENLLTALASYLSSFYVFNLEYPKGLRKSMQFIQRVFLQIKDKEKLHPSVYSLIEKL